MDATRGDGPSLFLDSLWILRRGGDMGPSKRNTGGSLLGGAGRSLRGLGSAFVSEHRAPRLRRSSFFERDVMERKTGLDSGWLASLFGSRRRSRLSPVYSGTCPKAGSLEPVPREGLSIRQGPKH